MSQMLGLVIQSSKRTPFIREIPEHIVWEQLSCNPGALHLLEKHPDKINWNQLSANPKANHLLFKLDYTQMRENDLREELMSYIFQPDRLMRLSRQFNLDLKTYLSFI